MKDQAAQIDALKFACKKLEANVLFFRTKLDKELPAFEKRRLQVLELRAKLVRAHHLSHAQCRSLSLLQTERSHALVVRHHKCDERTACDTDGDYEVSEEGTDEDEPILMACRSHHKTPKRPVSALM